MAYIFKFPCHEPLLTLASLYFLYEFKYASHLLWQLYPSLTIATSKFDLKKCQLGGSDMHICTLLWTVGPRKACLNSSGNAQKYFWVNHRDE